MNRTIRIRRGGKSRNKNRSIRKSIRRIKIVKRGGFKKINKNRRRFTQKGGFIKRVKNAFLGGVVGLANGLLTDARVYKQPAIQGGSYEGASENTNANTNSENANANANANATEGGSKTANVKVNKCGCDKTMTGGNRRKSRKNKRRTIKKNRRR